MKRFIVLVLLVSSTLFAKSQIDPTLAGQLQSILDSSVSHLGNHGVSAHLTMPNGQSWNGMAGVGKGNLAITDTTVFHGASTTKLNIAILMLLLAEDSLVDLDKSWNEYVSLNVGFDTLIAVRQLLNHTSGIADYLETSTSGNDVTANFNAFYTPQYILENTVSSTPDFPVGTNFNYSNSNYVLAALVAEAVTGNPVQTELRNRIWAPLGMNHTYFGAYDTYSEPTAGVWWNFGSGLTNYSNVPTTSMLSYAYAAGNIVTSPTDLALLLNALLGGQLLSPTSMAEMTTFVPQSFSSWTAGYGLGLHHATGQSNNVVLGHDGYYTNLTDAFHDMGCGFTLVTMTNTQTSWFGIFNPMYDQIAAYCAATQLEETEIEDAYDFSMFPNPTQGQFTINTEQAIVDIVVRDALGRICFQTRPGDHGLSLSLDSAGLYFVTVRMNEKTITRKLIVYK